MAVPFVDHHGHTVGGYTLLWRRYRSRYLFGIGELLRGAAGRPHLGQTLRDLPEVRLWFGVYGGWLLGIAALATLPLPAALAALAILAVLPTAALSLRYRSVAIGVYSFGAWNAHALGMALGFARPRIDPGAPIRSEVIEGRAAEVGPTRLRRAGAAG